MNAAEPDARAAPRARDMWANCTCGRLATHVRLVVAQAEDGSDSPGFTVSPHCGHLSSALEDPVIHPRAAHLGAESIPTLLAGPARWPDLNTAAVLIGLVTSYLSQSVLVVDLTARALFTNLAWSVMSGLRPEQSLAAGWHAAIDERSRRWLAEAVAAEDTPDREIIVVEASGRHRCRASLVMQPIVGFDGSPLGQVLWVPGSGPGAERLADPWASELGDPATAAFVARLQDSLDQHVEATTTVAALVVEVTADPGSPTGASVWENDIDAVMVEHIQPLLGSLQSLSPLGHRRVGIVCEEVDSYRDVIGLAERLIELGDRPSLVGGHPGPAPRMSVGVAFPHLPDGRADGLLAHALQATHLAQAQVVSGFEVVIGTGPGSSDVRRTRPESVQQHLSAPSANLQP